MQDTYVFDMGGVITRPYSLQALYDELNPFMTYQSFKEYLYNGEESEAVCKGLIDIEQFFLTLARKGRIKKKPEQILELYQHYKGALYQYTILIMQILKEKGNKICLLSNLHEADYIFLQDAMDMSIFDKEFLSFKMHKLKPDKEIYEDVINDLGTNDFFYFDDKKENIVTAQELGIKAYQTNGYTIGKTMQLINKQKHNI